MWYIHRYIRRWPCRRRIRQWGNSLGLRVPKALARDLGWADGSEVQLVREGEHLLVRAPSGPPAALSDLVAEISEYNIHADGGAEPTPPRPIAATWFGWTAPIPAVGCRT